jgi:hypothetical protein
MEKLNISTDEVKTAIIIRACPWYYCSTPKGVLTKKDGNEKYVPFWPIPSFILEFLLSFKHSYLPSLPILSLM